MSTPIVTGGGYMPLDGLLAALLFDALKDVEAAHAAIPVKNINGLFHAIGAVIEHIDKGRIAFIAALRQQHSINPDLILKNKQGNLLTLPLKNVSLAEWFNSDKENGNDENIKGALHARIQARGSALGGQRPKHRGGGAYAGHGRPDTVQLGQGA